MVTAAQVWDALAEIPDPEIPVISLVDLGVVREVEDFVDELGKNYHRVDGYSLKAKLKEARERAGTAAPDR